MKVTQYFTDDYLRQCRQMSPAQVLQYLDDFRCLHGRKPAPSKLISLKVPEDLLSAFKVRAGMADVPYQTQIKNLMKEWLQQKG